MKPPLEVIVCRASQMRSLGIQALASLLGLATLRTCPAGTTLYRAGQEASHLYILGEGTVSLLVPAALEGVFTSKTVSFGGTFGLGAIVEPYRYTRDAVATTEASLAAFPADALRAFLEAHSALGYHMLAALAAHQQREALRAIGRGPAAN